jgi:hypothetical protein
MSISARPEPVTESEIPAPEFEELIVDDDRPVERPVADMPLEADVADVLDQRRELDWIDDLAEADVYDATD